MLEVVGTMFFYDRKLLIDKPRKRPTYQMIGGKVEKGEKPVEAAIRECHEELGNKAIFDENLFELIMEFDEIATSDGKTPIHFYVFKYKGKINGELTTSKEIEKFKPYFGRVIVKFHKTYRGQSFYFGTVQDKLEVLQILPTLYDGDDFIGYENVCLSFIQLEAILKRGKRDWLAALKNQKAVYLITDKNNGKLYVGSATGKNGMLLQRWENYIATGHGGNKELVELVKEKGIEYIRKYFQYSILENYNMRTDDDYVLQRESWWKETLQSRKFGYNAN